VHSTSITLLLVVILLVLLLLLLSLLQLSQFQQIVFMNHTITLADIDATRVCTILLFVLPERTVVSPVHLLFCVPPSVYPSGQKHST